MLVPVSALSSTSWAADSRLPLVRPKQWVISSVQALGNISSNNCMSSFGSSSSYSITQTAYQVVINAQQKIFMRSQNLLYNVQSLYNLNETSKLLVYNLYHIYFSLEINCHVTLYIYTRIK